jgi:OOP family OmpA-OmpF porin
LGPAVDPGSGDDDSDGVINRSDRCPETPADEEAGVFGCAVGESFVVEGIDFDAEGGPSKDSRVKLDELADMLMASPGQQIEISGHTDATDDIGRDQWISAYRAIVVMKYLADRGVIVEDMIARAYGGTRPIASNDTEEGRAANRRIEIVRIQ